MLTTFVGLTLILSGCSTMNVCSNADGALTEAAFVIVTEPRSGERVTPVFTVAGCSRTFESSVNWQLAGRDGSILANGTTSGGGVDGHEVFEFSVDYNVAEMQIGHLSVYEEDASDGEGFPPSQNVIPVVLIPRAGL